MTNRLAAAFGFAVGTALVLWVTLRTLSDAETLDEPDPMDEVQPADWWHGTYIVVPSREAAERQFNAALEWLS